MWQEGDRIVGVGPELLQIAFNKLGTKVETRATGTWDEVIKAASEGKIDAVAALYKTDERQKYLDYSIPFSKDPVAVFVSKKRAFPYKNWDNLIGKKGTTTTGDSYGQAFDEFIKSKLQVKRFKTVEENFNLLLSGQADYFIFALYPGLLEAKKEGVADKVTYLKPYVATENWYLAISKRSKYASYLPAIDKIVGRLVQNGTVDELITKNMGYYEEHVLNRVRQLVEEGISYYKKHGEQSTFAEIDNPSGRLTRGDLYLFVFDFHGKCLSHGADPKLIGQNLTDLKDTDGKQFIKDFIKVASTKGEGWVAYKWPYKQTGEIEPKISYVKRIGDSDLFIGCGFYTTK